MTEPTPEPCESGGTDRSAVRLWQRLTTPAAIQGDKARQSAQTLASMLLIILPLVVIIGLFIMPIMSNAPRLWQGATFGPTILALIGLVVAYGLNRSGHYHIAATLFVFITIIMPLVAIIPDFSPTNLPIATLAAGGALLAGLLYRDQRITILAGLGAIVGVVAIVILIPPITFETVAAVLVALAMHDTITVIFVHYRNRLEQQHQAQLQAILTERDRAGIVLHERETLLSEAMRVAQMGYYTLDLVSGTLFWSDEIYRMIGLEPGSVELTVQFFLARIHEDDQENMGRAMETVVSTGQAPPLEYRILHEDGTTRWFYTEPTLHTDSEGQPLRIVGPVQDITERKQAEETRRESEERLQDAQRIAHLGNWQWNIGANDLAWSDEIYRIFGYEPSAFEPTYPAFLGCVHPDDRHAVEAAVASALQGEPYHIEHRIIRPDGTVQHVLEQGEVIYNDAGNPHMMNGILLDITDRKQAAAALQKEHDRAQQYLNTANTMIIVINKDETIGLLNKRGGEILGGPPEAIVGQNWFDNYLPAAMKDEVLASFRQLMSGDVIDMLTYYENLIVNTDGEERMIAWHNSLIRDDDGKPTGILSSGVDITESREQEKHIREQARLLDLIFQHSPESFAVLDRDFNFIRVNESYARAGQQDVSYFPGLNHFEVYPSDFKEEAEAAKAGKYIYNKAARPFTFADHPEWGTTYWNLGLVPVLDDDGEVELFLFTLKDVTEHVQAEQALQASEQRYRRLVETMHDGLGVLDEQGLITYVNDSLCQMLGYSSEELIGMPGQDLYDETNQRILADQIALRMQGAGNPYEIAWTTKEGRQLPTIMSPQPIIDDDGNFKGTFAVVTDITERKQTEQALHEERNLLRAILITVPDQIYVKDLEHRFILANRATRQYWEGHDLIGKTDLEILPPERAERRQEEEKTLFDTGQPIINFEDSVRNQQGEVAWALINKIPLRDADDNIIGLVGVNNDITERKQAEQALREERNLLRAIIEAIPDHIYVKDLEHRFILTNQPNQQYWEEDKLIGKTDADLVPPDRAAFHRQQEENILASGQPSIDQETLVGASLGKLRWLLINKIPLRDADGNLIGLVGVNRDITKHKQAEDALRDSQQLLEKTFASLNEAIFIVDAETRIITDCNAAVETIFGYAEPEVVGHSTEFLHVNHEMYAHFGNESPSERDTSSIFQTEYRMRRKDGSVFESEHVVSHIPSEGERSPRVVSVVRDITERKQAEDALRESEQTALEFQEKLSALHDVSIELTQVESLDDLYRLAVELGRTRLGFERIGLFLFDEATRMITGTYGINAEGQLQAIDQQRTMLPDDRKWQTVHDALQHHQHISLQTRSLYDAASGEVGYGSNALALLWDGDKAIGWIVTDNLLTQQAFKDYQLELLSQYGSIVGHLCVRKQIEEQLQSLNEQLEQRVTERTSELEAANQELESFAYSVSHDLRTPLRSINGFSQVLLDDYNALLDDEGKDSLRRVRASARRMGSLIDDLLHLSRVTRREIQRQQVDLSAIASNVATNLREAEPDRQVTFDLTPDLVVQGDDGLMKIVMDNLIGNAWKFSSKQDQARIEFGLEQQEGRPVYYVRDDGAGFDMAYADKLFGAFQRLHGIDEFEGTGVGLATVRRIILRHGGQIWAESAVDQGATFYFTL